MRNTPILELIKEYENENCVFDKPEILIKHALLYADRMDDSHLRCVLYSLAIQLERDIKLSSIIDRMDDKSKRLPDNITLEQFYKWLSN